MHLEMVLIKFLHKKKLRVCTLLLPMKWSGLMCLLILIQQVKLSLTIIYSRNENKKEL